MTRQQFEKKMALADFIIEAAAGIASGDIAGTAVLYTEMADAAKADGVMLPLVATIARRGQGGQGEMTDGELAAWLRGWVYQFDPRTAS